MPTPTRKKISASTETLASRTPAKFSYRNKSVESLNLWRFSDDFLSSTISEDNEKSSKSTLASPRVDIKETASQNISHGYNDDVDEYENSSELSSEMSCSAGRINNVVTTSENILDESSPNFSEGCSTRQSILIIKEVITLDSSSDDEIQSSDDMEEGVAEKTEYEKYLQLKEKYEGKRKPEFYSKLRAQK